MDNDFSSALNTNSKFQENEFIKERVYAQFLESDNILNLIKIFLDDFKFYDNQLNKISETNLLNFDMNDTLLKAYQTKYPLFKNETKKEYILKLQELKKYNIVGSYSYIVNQLKNLYNVKNIKLLNLNKEIYLQLADKTKNLQFSNGLLLSLASSEKPEPRVLWLTSDAIIPKEILRTVAAAGVNIKQFKTLKFLNNNNIQLLNGNNIALLFDFGYVLTTTTLEFANKNLLLLGNGNNLKLIILNEVTKFERDEQMAESQLTDINTFPKLSIISDKIIIYGKDSSKSENNDFKIPISELYEQNFQQQFGYSRWKSIRFSRPKGSIVFYNGQQYVALENIPANDTEVPGTGDLWEKLSILRQYPFCQIVPSYFNEQTKPSWFYFMEGGKIAKTKIPDAVNFITKYYPAIVTDNFGIFADGKAFIYDDGTEYQLRDLRGFYLACGGRYDMDYFSEYDWQIPNFTGSASIFSSGGEVASTETSGVFVTPQQSTKFVLQDTINESANTYGLKFDASNSELEGNTGTRAEGIRPRTLTVRFGINLGVEF